MNNIPTINEIDNNSPSQDSKDVVVSATVNQPQINEVEETASGKATIEEIDATRKPTISEIYQIINDGLFEATTNWWDYSYKLSQAQINQDIISRLDKGIIGGGYSKGVDIITTTSDKTPTNANVYSALKSDSLYPKKLNDETINGIYDFLNGIAIGKFTNTTGARIYPDSYGYSHLDVDYLNVRLKAIFETLQILNVETIGGKMVISPAGSIRISYVDTISKEIDGLTQNVYRCYFLGEQDGNEIDNKWKVGDQAQAKSFNVKKGTYHKVGNHYLWRLVVGVSEETVDINNNKYHYVDLSDIDCAAGSDIPQPGDVLNQFGYRGDDVQRQSALVFSAVDGNAPSITLYSGVNSYDMTGKEYVEYGVAGGKAYFNIYGETYIGARDKSTYIDYHNGKLSIKADISAASVGDKSLIQYIDSNKGLNEDQVKTIANGVKADLQKQIDNTIETWFYNGEPTNDNVPAVDWKTDKIDIRESHVGDLYYDRDTGIAYRYTKYTDDINPYRWDIVRDTTIAKALDAANNAQATADGKMSVYNEQPKSYKKGDIWVNATYFDKFNNDIVVALKDNDIFDIADWQLASRYDEALAELTAFSNQYKTDIENINKQFDHVAQTWYQSTDPSKNNDWKDSEHDGDLWYDTTNSKTYIYSNGEWVQKFIPDEVFNSINGKSTIFVDDGNNITEDSPINKGYDVGDIWILPKNWDEFKEGEILKTTTKSNTFNKTHWIKATAYTNDDKVNMVVANINGFMGAADVLDNTFKDAAKDGIFNAAEKTAILKEVDNIKDTQSRINAIIVGLLKSEYFKGDKDNTYNEEGTKLNDAKTTFNTNINSYLQYISDKVEAGTYTKLDESYYSNRQNYVSTAIKTIQNAISAAELYINVQTKESIIGDVTSQYGYLAEAIKKGTTNIKGGLVSTNTIVLSDIINDNGNYVVTAGINGQRTKNGITNDKAIAAWFGGPMEDRDIVINDSSIKNPIAGTDYAMSVFRHDGTGYLAGGKISWDDKGVLIINPDSILANVTSMGGQANLLYTAMLFQYHWKNEDRSTFDNLLYVSPLRSFSDLNIITNLVVGYTNSTATEDSFIQIGKIKLSYDSTNKALKISHIDNNANANLYTTGNIAAYGIASSTGGSGFNGTILNLTSIKSMTLDANDLTKIPNAAALKNVDDRLSIIETNGATSIKVTGLGNAITSVSKDKTVITFTKGSSFSVSGHTHSWSNITDKPTLGTAAAQNTVGIFSSIQHSDYNNNQGDLITRSFMSYWNGAYNSDGNSNLTYCNQGAFGSFAARSSLAFSELTSKPTTLSGYGITDAKISNGVITLGSNSITPLTSHQSLSGKLSIDGSNSMTGNLYLASIGSSYIGKGAKDTSGSDYTDANIVIRSWWGITFKSYDNVNRTYLDTRSGDFGTKGNIYANNFYGIIKRNSGGATICGRDNAIVRQTYAPGGSSWNPIACVDTETGTWTLGHLSIGDSDTNFSFCFSTNDDYNNGRNNGTYVNIRNVGGTLALTSEIPTNLNQLSNGPGYVTGSVSGNTITINGTSTTWQNTWRGITDSYGGTNTSVSLSQKGGNDLYNALINGYASSAGNADTLDSEHGIGYVRTRVNLYSNPNNIAKNVGGYIGMIIDANDTSFPEGKNDNWHHIISANYNNSPNGGNSDGNYWCTQLINTAGSNKLYIRSRNGGNDITKGWTSWEQLARVNDNVASATKLQTARSIWGQSFDGTANVDGTLRIKCTTGNYQEGLCIQNADSTWCTIRLGNTANSGTTTNTWSIHRKSDNNFCISRNSCDGSNGLVMTTTGMGLGTTSPSYRLHVNGTAHANLFHVSDGNHTGIQLGSAYLSCLNGNAIFQNCTAIRFGNDAWDWSQWAGLKYNHSNNTIYLGLADGTIFSTNAAQTGGRLYFPNINDVYCYNSFKIVRGSGNINGTTYYYHTTYGKGSIVCNFGIMAPSNTITLQSNTNGIILDAYGEVELNSNTGHGIILNAKSKDVIMNTYAGVIINSNSNSTALTANGNILATGGVTAYSSSDIRLKSNIKTFDYIKTIKSLGNVYEFDYIKDGKHSIGLIAQNVQKSSLTDLVDTDDEGYLKLNYWSPKLISLALGGITQIDDEVTRLKARVRELENEVKQLKNK